MYVSRRTLKRKVSLPPIKIASIAVISTSSQDRWQASDMSVSISVLKSMNWTRATIRIETNHSSKRDQEELNNSLSSIATQRPEAAITPLTSSATLSSSSRRNKAQKQDRQAKESIITDHSRPESSVNQPVCSSHNSQTVLATKTKIKIPVTLYSRKNGHNKKIRGLKAFLIVKSNSSILISLHFFPEFTHNLESLISPYQFASKLCLWLSATSRGLVLWLLSERGFSRYSRPYLQVNQVHLRKQVSQVFLYLQQGLIKMSVEEQVKTIILVKDDSYLQAYLQDLYDEAVNEGETFDADYLIEFKRLKKNRAIYFKCQELLNVTAKSTEQKKAAQDIYNLENEDDFNDKVDEKMQAAITAKHVEEESEKAAAKARADALRAAAATSATSTTPLVSPIKKPSLFSVSSAITGRKIGDRLSNTVLYSRKQRSEFSFEDTSRFRAQAIKGYSNGYKTTDLDALARTDKPEDRSKALKSITHVIQTNHRFEEALVPYGMDEAFKINILERGNPRVIEQSFNLFEDWHKVTPEQIIESCNNYTLYVKEPAILKTWEQDFVWSRQKLDGWTTDDSVLQKVNIGMEIYKPHERTGPLAFKILMNTLIQCSTTTRAVLKQAWLYHMKPTDNDGGNIPAFTTDWRSICQFLGSLGENTSDSPCQLYQALTTCPNIQFANHFRTLYTMNDPKINIEEALITEANTQYIRLTAEGKWSVRSTKEHAAFRQKKREDEKKKAQKLAAKKAAASGNPTNPKANQGQVTKKTHDAQGHAINRTPPKEGESKQRTITQTKQDEWYCENKHCNRWGNHATDKHDEWYKKLLENKKKRQENNKDKALESQSSTGAPQIPTNPLNGQSRERG